ncbi:EF-hand domain-containing protein [Mariniflexile gromovii]|uniref:EF-hand domain-containing protein n=1 Tax=Mariniflexile gromovii TaxID=362523 RepID=A0ABS4BT50_9FLAO|nr:EF-hand domain-containing protein [Mariniflexile gromovii]MBP0903758.1 EF-hand domain-containing protein [Mariniflexile gromovii]
MKTTILKFALFSFALLAFSQVNAQDRQKPDPEKMFTALDTNKDGTVSLDEMKARKTKREVTPEAQEKRFAAMDADANGAITLEEFKTAMAKVKGRGQGEGKKKQE